MRVIRAQNSCCQSRLEAVKSLLQQPDWRGEGRRRKREEGEKIGKAVVERPELVVCQRARGRRGRPSCALHPPPSRWQLWKRSDFHSAARTHEWNGRSTRAPSRARAAVGQALPLLPAIFLPPPALLSPSPPKKAPASESQRHIWRLN